MLIRFTPIRPSISVPNFSQIEACICSYSDFSKCVKRRIRRKKQRNFFPKFYFIAHILEISEGIFFKFGLWPPLNGGHLHCKFGSGITELRMCENLEFVVSVNMLTPFRRVPFSVLLHNYETRI